MDRRPSFVHARRALWAAVLLAQFLLGYCVNTVAKLLSCSVGFDVADAARRVLSSLTVSFVPFVLPLPIVPIGFVWACFAFCSRFADPPFVDAPWRKLRSVVLACLAGCAVSEAWMLLEEWSFARSVEGQQVTEAFVSRSWPFEGFGLFYRPDRGMWAVD